MLLPKRIKKRNKRRSTSTGVAPNKESTYTAPASDTPIKEYVGAVSHSGNASVDELDIRYLCKNGRKDKFPAED